jgi:hypothetical protein
MNCSFYFFLFIISMMKFVAAHDRSIDSPSSRNILEMDPNDWLNILTLPTSTTPPTIDNTDAKDFSVLSKALLFNSIESIGITHSSAIENNNPLILVIEEFKGNVNYTYHVVYSTPTRSEKYIKASSFSLISNDLPAWLFFHPVSTDSFIISIDYSAIAALPTQYLLTLQGWVTYGFGLRSVNSTQLGFLYVHITSSTSPVELELYLNVIDNPRTNRKLAMPTGTNVNSIVLGGKYDISLKSVSICTGSFAISECVFAGNTWLNVEENSIVHIKGSAALLGLIQIQKNAQLIIDLPSADGLVLLQYQAELENDVISLLNNGTIKILSGRLILSAFMKGTGSIEVSSGATLELRNENAEESIYYNRIIPTNTEEEERSFLPVLPIPLLKLAGRLNVVRGIHRFQSAIRATPGAAISVLPAATLSFDSALDLDEIVHYDINCLQFINRGNIQVLNSTVNITAEVLQSIGAAALLNISQFGSFALYLNDLDHNLVDNLYVEHGILGVINSGVFGMLRGKLNISSGYQSDSAAHTMISTQTIRQAHLIFDTSLVSNDYDIQIGGIEFINNGELSIVAGKALFTTPLLQLTGGKLNLMGEETELTLASSLTSTFSVCLLFTNCPSVAVDQQAQLKIESNSGLLLLPNATAGIEQLNNQGKVSLASGSTLSVQNYFQDDQAVLNMAEDSRFLGRSEASQCHFNGRIIGSGEISCANSVWNNVEFRLENDWQRNVLQLRNDSNYVSLPDYFPLLSQAVPSSLLLTPIQTLEPIPSNHSSKFSVNPFLRLPADSSLNFHIYFAENYNSVQLSSPSCVVRNKLRVVGAIQLPAYINSTELILIHCEKLEFAAQSIQADGLDCANCDSSFTKKDSDFVLQLRRNPRKLLPSNAAASLSLFSSVAALLLTIAGFLLVLAI